MFEKVRTWNTDEEKLCWQNCSWLQKGKWWQNDDIWDFIIGTIPNVPAFRQYTGTLRGLCSTTEDKGQISRSAAVVCIWGPGKAWEHGSPAGTKGTHSQSNVNHGGGQEIPGQQEEPNTKHVLWLWTWVHPTGKGQGSASSAATHSPTVAGKNKKCVWQSRLSSHTHTYMYNIPQYRPWHLLTNEIVSRTPGSLKYAAELRSVCRGAVTCVSGVIWH